MSRTDRSTTKQNETKQNARKTKKATNKKTNSKISKLCNVIFNYKKKQLFQCTKVPNFLQD